MSKTINILGYPYILDTQTKDIAALGGNIGLCDLDNGIITIATDTYNDMKDSVAIHEILEAVNYHLEIELTEKQIKQIEVGLHQVFKGCGIPLRYLTEDKKD